MRHSVYFALALFCVSSSLAQVEKLPRSVQDVLHEVGPTWGTNLDANIGKTLEAFTPVLHDAPKGGVRIVRDLSYGPDRRHKLDIYQPAEHANVPVVVFLHGGAYVSGERDINDEVYSNVPLYFARQGMLGVNATYRLAPMAQWPAGAEDIRAVVQWLKANVGAYGGDPQRIYLVGHSAGATHVATYAYIRALQPPDGLRIAGMVLMSGRYRVDPKGCEFGLM
jgi:acetyl esterase/lipase